MQPAPVAVPDERRDRDAEQQAPQENPDDPEPAAAFGDDAQTEDPLAGGETDRAHGQHTEYEEDAERPVSDGLPVTIREQPVCDQEAEPPVDEDGAEPPPEGAMEPGPASGRPSRSPR